MPSIENDEPLAWYRDEIRASQRASEDRRDAAFRLRRRRLRGRTGVAVLVASLTVLVGGAAASPSAIHRSSATQTTTRAVQQALGIAADGIYGPQTRAAIIRFQRASGLVPDGIAGPLTLAALGVAGGRQEARAIAARTPSATSGDTGALLQRIAECESGGDPTVVSQNGLYRGKYQFSRETWRGVGGTGDPAAASEAEQDRRAAMLLDMQGASAWPVCSG